MLAVKIDQKDLQRLGAFISDIKDTHGLMREIGQYMASSTQRKLNAGIQPENAPLTRAWKKGRLPLRDTGKYISSISFKSDNTTAVIGTKAIQGRLIHEGGTIKPKEATKLYIPAGWKTRQMMKRFGLTPGKCIAGMKGAGYSVWKSKSGKAMMAALRGAKGKKGDAFVLFILKESVTIPKRRHFFIDSVDKQVLIEKVVAWLKKK